MNLAEILILTIIMQRRQECHVTNPARRNYPAKLPKEHMQERKLLYSRDKKAASYIFETFVKDFKKIYYSFRVLIEFFL
jgi:hypothetical protein